MEYPFQYKQFWCQSCCQTLPSWFSYLHERKSKVQWQGAQGGPWLRTVKELRPWIQQSLRNRILPTTKVSLEAVLSPVKLLEETSTLADYLTVVLWETLKWRRPSLAAFVTYRYGPNKCMMSKLLRSDNVSNGNRPKKKKIPKQTHKTLLIQLREQTTSEDWVACPWFRNTEKEVACTLKETTNWPIKLTNGN